MKILLSLLALAACAGPAPDRISAQLNVWRIETTRGSGSGSPIRQTPPHIWFLTAKHLEPSTEWSATTTTTTLKDGAVIRRHPTEDVMIIAFPNTNTNTNIPIHHPRFDPLELGTVVYGSGWAHRYHWLTHGIVSGPQRVTCPIAPGDSGGALLDAQGYLIGVLVARLSRHDAHMGVVVPIHKLKEWL